MKDIKAFSETETQKPLLKHMKSTQTHLQQEKLIFTDRNFSLWPRQTKKDQI